MNYYMKNLAFVVLVIQSQSALTSSSPSAPSSRAALRKAAKGLWMLPASIAKRHDSVKNQRSPSTITKKNGDSFTFIEEGPLLPDDIDMDIGSCTPTTRYSSNNRRRSRPFTTTRIIKSAAQRNPKENNGNNSIHLRTNQKRSATKSKVTPTSLELRRRRSSSKALKDKYKGNGDDDDDDDGDEELWGLTKLLVPKRLRHKGVPVPGIAMSRPDMQQARDAVHGFL